MAGETIPGADPESFYIVVPIMDDVPVHVSFEPGVLHGPPVEGSDEPTIVFDGFAMGGKLLRFEGPPELVVHLLGTMYEAAKASIAKHAEHVREEGKESSS